MTLEQAIKAIEILDATLAEGDDHMSRTLREHLMASVVAIWKEYRLYLSARQCDIITEVAFGVTEA